MTDTDRVVIQAAKALSALVIALGSDGELEQALMAGAALNEINRLMALRDPGRRA